MLEEFTSPLVKDLKAGNNVVQKGDVTIKLAQDFGFCWGVERAIAMSFQVRSESGSDDAVLMRIQYG